MNAFDFQPVREHGYTDLELQSLTNHELVDLYRDVKAEITDRAAQKRFRGLVASQAKRDY